MSIRFTTLLVAAVFGLAGTQVASAKKKPVDKFAAFKGNFTGSASFVTSTSSPPITGTGTIGVSGPVSGKSLQLAFAGNIAAGGSSAPYSNVITFTKAGAFVVQDGVFRLAGGSTTYPVSGTAAIRKQSISGTGFFPFAGSPASISFTIVSKTVGRNRTLTIDYVLTNASGSYPFKFVASGRIKKVKK